MTTELTDDNVTEEVPTSSPISLADLSLLAQIVDAAVQKGAFNASQAEVVGGVYNRLTNFLQSVADAAPESEEDGTEKGDE